MGVSSQGMIGWNGPIAARQHGRHAGQTTCWRSRNRSSDPGSTCQRGIIMNITLLRSTTAIVLTAALLQPAPLRAQADATSDTVENDATTEAGSPAADTTDLTSEEICAEAGITDPAACTEYIRDRETAAAAEDSVDVEAEAELEAEAEAAAEADSTTEAAPEAETAAEMEAAPETEAEAEAVDTTMEAEAEEAATAESATAAEALTEPETVEAAEPQAETESAAEIEAAAEAEAADAELAGDDVTRQDCLAEVVDEDGESICVDTLSADTVAALATDDALDIAAEAEVTLETITEDAVRDSTESFGDWRGAPDTENTAAPQADRGSSDLERAGLFALGAVVVGAILANGQRVEANTGDRIIVMDRDGTYGVLRDDNAILRQPGSELRTERFADGSTRSVVTYDDGTSVVTIRDSGGRALRRLRIDPDGQEYLLFDDTRVFAPVMPEDLPRPVAEGYDDRIVTDTEALRRALVSSDSIVLGRSFSLRQVRNIPQVRALAPEITLSGITFETNSAAIEPSQIEALRDMGALMNALIVNDPTEMFLIEGYTDAVGAAGYNLLLSDRRAESVALAFTGYFDVPPGNMVVQGYGESDLRIATQEPERANRRVAVRRITPLLRAD